MSQSSADTAATESLIIDLNKTQQATVLDASSILHKMQLRAFLDRVHEVVGRVDDFKKQLKAESDGAVKSIGYTRYHDVITVHGKRGSGKTTFLLSALTLLQKPAKRKAVFSDEKYGKALDDLCVLEIMDPTLFGLNEHLLLSLLGKIAQKVRCHKQSKTASPCDNAADNCKMEAWEKSLSSLAKGLKYIGEGRDDLNSSLPQKKESWEDPEFLMEKGMDSARRGIELERRFHHFLNDSLEILGKKAFVLALDDIDTRPTIGWHVLEVLRRYFTSPQLVVILSGDMDLFKKLIEKWQLEIFGLSFTSSKTVLAGFKECVDGLTEQYLLKILRTPSRINLGSFQTALHQWKNRPLLVQKADETKALDALIKDSFYPALACHTSKEQKLFQQALYTNSSRSVAQVLDALIPLKTEGIATRLREVFLIPLQNMGFEQPFDLAEALQNPRGITVLMKQLFTHGYVQRGLDLLPSRSEQSENNGLLALQAELTQAMHNNSSVLFAYLFKACLLRQVLVMQDKDFDKKNYPDIESYLALESQELPSVTASRISALHWGDPKNSPVRNMGLLRLYGASITKNSPDAMRAMYGGTLEELKAEGAEIPCPTPLAAFRAFAESCGLDASKAMGGWINTPETLRDTVITWQRDLTSLGIIEVRRGDGTYRAFSIFSLLTIMGDILECEAESLPSLFAKYTQTSDINIYGKNTSQSRDLPYDNDAEDETETEEARHTLNAEMQTHKEAFFAALTAWSDENKKITAALPATLCARIMTRFCGAIQHIEENMSNRTTFVGDYTHRCIVAFLNSVLVEEYLLNTRQSGDAKFSIALENPTTKDDIFLKNMADTGVIMQGPRASHPVHVVIQRIGGRPLSVNSLSRSYPLFAAAFSFPLWGLYLRPDKSLEGDNAHTVYGIYMRLHAQGKDAAQQLFTVAYNKAETTCPNLYPLLNSLAMPKPLGSVSIIKTSKTTPPTREAKNTENTGQTVKVVAVYPAEPKEDLRTAVGKNLALPLNPNSLWAQKIINDLGESKPRMLKSFHNIGGDMPHNFPATFRAILARYYHNAEQVKDFDFDGQCNKFWNTLRKNVF